MAPEDKARAYCVSIGADPDELIVGWSRNKWGGLDRYESERWRWYVGAEISAPRTCPRHTFIKLVE